MITVFKDKINTLDQISYDKILENINILQLTCSCGLSGCLIKHGYYKRSFKTTNGMITLSILRVKCKHCGKTHAIFIDFFVPYSQILLQDHVSIITSYESKSSFEPIMLINECIDESNIRYIITKYLKHWKERIASLAVSITEDVSLLSKLCLCTFKRQFMQIKNVPNILFC